MKAGLIMEFDDIRVNPYNNEMVKRSFGFKVKVLRKRTGLSQSKFAAFIGVNVRTYQDWEVDRFHPQNEELILLGVEKKIDERF